MHKGNSKQKEQIRTEYHLFLALMKAVSTQHTAEANVLMLLRYSTVMFLYLDGELQLVL